MTVQISSYRSERIDEKGKFDPQFLGEGGVTSSFVARNDGMEVRENVEIPNKT